MNSKHLIYTIGVFCLFFINSSSIKAQSSTKTNFTKEFSFKTENDAYLFKLDDAYYTNGFFLNYHFVNTKSTRKTIHSLELGQKIFTPLIRTTASPADIDRAYCGYLYLGYGQTAFLPKDAVLQLNGSLGVVGPASWGEGLQNTYHGWLKYAKFLGWNYQIANSLGIDASATYAKTMVQSNQFKWVPVVQLSLGTTYTNAKLGSMFVLGAFEKNSESALWNARISSTEKSTQRKHEFFGYWYPQLMVQGYNATIQGGVFNKGANAVTQSPSSFVFQQEIGLCYAQGRFTTKLAWNYQSKETPSQTRAQRFGSMQISYRIH